jgi:dipeptidyl aminopeptidase/acylaminoacyl peptidase
MRLVLLAIFVGVTATAGPQSSTSHSPARNAAFSVRDSIEMTQFSDPFTRTPGATAKEAPDGRGFVVVTTKGNLSTNTLESCLWYFSAKDIRSYLENNRTQLPHPRLLMKRVGIPEAEQLNSYGSLITNVQWAPDSKGLRVVVEGTHGVRHPYHVRVTGQGAMDLVPSERGDITGFTSRSGTLAYLTSPPRKTVKKEIPAVSAVVTGHGLLDTLFPSEFPDAPGIGRAWKLRVLFKGRTLTLPGDPSRYFPCVGSRAFTPSISPDGSSVVTLVPVDNVPPSWSAYQSADHTLRFLASTTTSDRSGRHIDWPWQYALVDLKSGHTVPMLDAPTAYTTAWGGPWGAKWSSSGSRVLLTKTYLDLDKLDRYAYDSVRPCAIAEFTIKSKETTCLAETPAPEDGEVLISAGYDADDLPIAEWAIRGKQTVRRFDPTTERWTTTNALAPTSTPLTIYVRQDIDVPPTLWVRTGSNERLLWDPNSQLHAFHFGRASVYEWTDSSGYTWRGGLVLPPSPRPSDGYPLVIQTHGFYNEHEFLVDGAFTTGSAAQPLASAGIAVLQMEDRAGRRSRPAEGEADDEVRGIEAAIDGLVKDRTVDPAKVGIQGFSRTSWYVERALEHSPERFRAALLIDGIDQSYVQDVLFTPGYPSTRSEIESSIGASPFGGGLMSWFRNAAGFNLDRVAAPVRLEALGSTFSVLGEWEIYSILQQQGKIVDFVNIIHAQHILQKPKERYVSQQGAVDWFRYWLQGYRRLDAEGGDEYLRWDHLSKSTIYPKDNGNQ